jgi:8-oxo-dGTP pyrophosphatase MutT (NUDIX family)
MAELRIRRAARAVVLDPDDRILLVSFEGPEHTIWLTTGGGIDEGETDEEAVRRELWEEAGLTGFELGPLIWMRTHEIPLAGGRWDGQSERYYLVRVQAFDPAPNLTWEQLREEGMTGVRWWTLDELEAAETLFAPRRLPALLRSLLEEGPPPEPVDVGF